MLGSKTRDRIRIYADTTDRKDPKVYAARMRKRKEMGLTFFKMDLHTARVKDRPGAVNERGGLRNGFDAIIDNRAVDAIHPDIETSGGLLETRRIADAAAAAGMQVAMHHAGSPVGDLVRRRFTSRPDRWRCALAQLAGTAGAKTGDDHVIVHRRRREIAATAEMLLDDSVVQLQAAARRFRDRHAALVDVACRTAAARGRCGRAACEWRLRAA